MLTFEERLAHCMHPITKKLLNLIIKKKTNLALSADVIRSEELLALANKCGPEICVLKTHVDIIEDFSFEFIRELQALAKQHDFLIFEDRKFADIGSTVKRQYQGGMYHIAEWADIINAHTLPGPGIITGLAEVGVPKQKGLLLLAEMSTANHLMDEQYLNLTTEMAKNHRDFVMGFICQRRLISDPAFICFTPGVRFSEKNAEHGQRYIEPDTAILNHDTDIIIVGRGILFAPSIQTEARRYRLAGWEAYLKKIG